MNSVSQHWLTKRQHKIFELEQFLGDLNEDFEWRWNCRRALGEFRQLHEHRMNIQKLFKHKNWEELDLCINRRWEKGSTLMRTALWKFLNDLPPLDYLALAKVYSKKLEQEQKKTKVYSKELEQEQKKNAELNAKIFECEQKLAQIEIIKHALLKLIQE